MADESKFQGDPKEKIMREILATKTLYDTEYDRVQGVFAPMVEYLDHDSKRKVLFVDPLKLKSAQAFGISPTEFLSFELKEQGMSANFLQLYMIFNAASGANGGTAPCATPVADLFRKNAADVVVPKSHMRETSLDIPGLSQKEITTLVNYHEFFHCLHDKYASTHTFENTPQKREMFADVGATLEMMRRGTGPEVIDELIVWRMRGKDDAHQTIPALLALKKHMRENGGVEAIRNMKTKDVLDLCYKATEEGSSMSWISRMHGLMQEMPALSKAAEKAQHPKFNWKDLPFGKDPTRILEDKAFELGGKITPKTLMMANNALQKDYADQHGKNQDSMASMYTAAFVQDAYMKLVKAEDYDGANAKRGGKLTVDDKEEIAFVKQPPKKQSLLESLLPSLLPR